MKTFNEGLEGLLEAIKMDYYRWYSRTEYCKGDEDAMDQAEQLKNQMSFEEGRAAAAPQLSSLYISKALWEEGEEESEEEHQDYEDWDQL